MTVNEAVKKLPNGLIAVSCIEYNDIFVFQAIPREYQHEDTSQFSDSLYSVHKDTGFVDIFDPTSMPVKAFRSGKHIDMNITHPPEDKVRQI